MKQWIISGFVMAIIGLTLPHPVHANAAPTFHKPEEQSIIFETNSGIQLVEETVNVEISAADALQANVKVEYLLKNLDAEEKDLRMFFVTGARDSSAVIVTVNQMPVEYIEHYENREIPQNWRSLESLTITDPVTLAETVVDADEWGWWKPATMNGFAFPVSFLPDQTITIQIEYANPSGYYGALVSSNKKTMLQVYYLTPAQFWDGEAVVNLTFTLPLNKEMAVHSNIPITKRDQHYYTTTLEQVPDSEWIISYREIRMPDKIYFLTGLKPQQQWIVAATLIAAVIASILVKRRRIMHERTIKKQ